MARRELDQRWGQLVAAVQDEFSRQAQDPAMFVPDRDRLKLLARVDRPGVMAAWVTVSVTPEQMRSFDLDGMAREFVAHYRRQQERRRQRQGRSQQLEDSTGE